jgi:hypothetical protein
MHNRRFAVGALLTIAACMTALVGAPTPNASAATITFTPVTDTYVASDAPGTSFGTRTQRWIDRSPTRRIAC